MRALFFLFSFLAMALSVHGAGAANMPDGTRPWFKQVLTSDNDHACAAILAATQARFVTGDNFGDVNGPLPSQFGGFTKMDWDAESNPDIAHSAAHELLITEGDGPQLQLTHVQQSGCGGCGSEAFEVAPTAAGGTVGHPLGTTSFSANWTIYNTDKGEYYLIGLTDKYFLSDTARPQIEVWHLGAPAWKVACLISLAPNLDKPADPDLQTALAAINALNASSKGMTHAYGENCGSAHFPQVADSNIQDALQKTLYRPWALNSEPQNEASKDGLEHFLTFLRQWSLGGLSEQQSYRVYQQQLSKAQTTLAGFYERKFGWSKDAALAAAKLAPHRAMVGNYPVSSSYIPPASLALRAAIMAQRPMEEIRALPLETAQAGDESLLDSAILYPQALSYLLDKGLNPNEPNPFGKTPLMYAAQYNQMESTRILLAHRADPNARTFEVRGCDIDVKTGNMTALHYAARYAAAGVMRLLVEKGAVPFVRAHNDDWGIDDKRAQDETAGDWLAYYTRGTGEQNRLVTAADRPALKDLLKDWDKGRIKAFAAEQAARGNAAWRQGDREGAYQALSVAALADPQNRIALNDLPLAAVKTGRLGDAIAAAHLAAEKSRTKAELAAARFNLALACDGATRKPAIGALDGEDYCGRDTIDLFIKAWQTQPNAARAAGIVTVMKTPQTTPYYPTGCTLGGSDYRFGFHDQDEKVYVLHPAGTKPDPNAIQWSGVAERPKLLESFALGGQALGGQALTVMGVRWQTGDPVIAGHVCK